MTCFRIDLDEADRAGNHPVRFEGLFIGVSHEPFVSAAQWLTRYKGAKPGDTIDRRAGGVQLQYARISSADGFPRRIEKDQGKDLEPGPGAPDSPEDDQADDEGEDSAEDAERRRKRKQKKVGDMDDTTTAPPSDPRDSDASYDRLVRANVAAILAAHAKATGRIEPISHAEAEYARTIAAASGEHSSYGAHVKALSDAIVAVHRKVRSL